MIFTFCRLTIEIVVYPEQHVVHRISETPQASSPLSNSERNETEEKYRKHGNRKQQKTIDPFGTTICERDRYHGKDAAARVVIG